jgi:hypothetical protein
MTEGLDREHAAVKSLAGEVAQAPLREEEREGRRRLRACGLR